LREVVEKKLKDALATNNIESAADFTYQLGRILAEKGVPGQEYELHQECFKNAADLFRKVGNYNRQAECLMRLAEQHGRFSEFDKAAQFYLAAAKEYKTLKDQEKNLWATCAAGIALTYKNKISEALEQYNSGIALCEERKDKHGLAGIYNNMGIAFELSKNYKEAIAYYEKCFKLYVELGNVKGAANATLRLSYAHTFSGNDDTGLKLAEKSLKLFEELNDKAGIANAVFRIGRAELRRQGESKKIINCFNRSLKLCEEAKDRLGMAQVLYDLASIHYLCEEFNKTSGYFERSLKYYEEMGYASWVSNILLTLGPVYLNCDAVDKAISCFDRYLKLEELRLNKNSYSGWPIAVAQILQYFGENEHAVSYYKQAMKLKEELKDKEGLEMIRKNLKLIEQGAGEDSMLLSGTDELLAEKEKDVLKGFKYEELFRFGQFRRKRKDYDKALTFLERAAELARKEKNHENLLNAIIGMTDCLENTGKSKECLDLCEQLLREFPADANIKNLTAWYLIATKNKELRNPGRALVLAKQASDATKRTRPEILDTLAEAYHGNNQFQEAIDTESVAEKLRPGAFQESLARYRKALKTGQQIERPDNENESKEKAPKEKIRRVMFFRAAENE
jgi:tetratricopeptide (TPR) repeat protein